MVFGGLVKRFKKVKLGGDSVVILDFTDRTIKLPNGDVIRKEDIISFDSQTNTLIYRGPSGELKTVVVGGGENLADRLLSSFMEKLAKRNDSQLHI